MKVNSHYQNWLESVGNFAFRAGGGGAAVSQRGPGEGDRQMHR